MAKRKQKGMGFAIFMVVYALVALVGIAFGLKWFWGFISAYEASRPHIAIDAYMEELTAERIVDESTALLEQIDHNIQSEEACREFLLDSLDGKFTYARKASACNETEQTYVLRSGSQVIGSFTIVTAQEDSYGFTPWVFGEEQFDLSYLMGTETVSVVIPEGCGISVIVNGVALDESYIVASESSEYELLEDFYGKYDLPVFTLNTYEAGPFLNTGVEVQVLDAEGNPFTYDASFDPDAMLAMTDEAVMDELEGFIADFLDAYVIFSGCANDSRYANYSLVIKYVVPDSGLAKRMQEALAGLEYAQSKGDEVDTITIHHFVEMEQDVYMCDVTYLVNTTGRQGVVQTTTNVKMIIVRSGDQLLVESMIGY